SMLQETIASSLDWNNERNGVVYEALQFPSLTYVWDAWRRRGARPVRVPTDDGRTIPTQRIIDAIDERTNVVLLSHAYFQSGALVDVAPIAKRAHELGALVVVDIYQTAGVVPIDVVALGADVAVGGSHKWLCGGPGCAWLYLKPELRARFEPAVTGWMAHARPFEFEPAPMTYADSMYRFGTGTPTIPGYVVARPGHDTIAEIGVSAIRQHNVRLTTKLAEMALERGLTVNTPLDPERRTGWIGIDFAGAQPLHRRLIEERIFVDYRPGCGIRVSPHFYTTDSEIDAFFDALDRLRAG
ncbi:MAG: aminotransferase class V-fold PLP-dependent enzyme, partial [Candidatus Eremiobacteraeota bacterium]|nr:aminotransferase class V-fold PLP-dependent enzyme [Candidatus Eremiobacteraeota bacterium]